MGTQPPGIQIPKVPKWTPEELAKAVSESRSIREVCFRLKLKATGGNYSTIKRVARKNGIDLSILPGKYWHRGVSHPTAHTAPRPLKEILVKGSCYKSAQLKKRLVAEGIKDDRCEGCGQGPIWNEELLVLQLDHVNGDTEDNRLRNLRVLCPNCHSQTKTFAGRNCGRRQ